jgi:probable phosphoglycerate mutase
VTTFYIARHGDTDIMSAVLCGRTPGIGLNETGRARVHRTASGLRRLNIRAVISSPVQRAVETASILAEALRVSIETCQEISEMDFGEWTGRTFAELQEDPRWNLYNSHRAIAPVPGGESFLEVQHRMVRCLERLRNVYPASPLLVVSHGDPIKSVVAHYLGLHLDRYERFEIAPASITVLQIDHGASLLALNWQTDLAGNTPGAV